MTSSKFASFNFSSCKEIIKSLGVVFGDIGTSPIYTLPAVFWLIGPTLDNVIGISSLVIWTLILLVFVEYAWLAMGLGKKGEGGTIVLKELLMPLLKSSRQVTIVTLLAFLGISLLFGDGVITPAVSILSAVEGFLLVPAFENIHVGHPLLIVIACLISCGLFIIQRKGTERVASAFGPMMLVWFLVIGLSGLASIMTAPFVVKAMNPYYAFKFLFTNGLASFFILSEVMLCATGGEALYADMGHLGRKPILQAWYIVFIAIVLSYLGQAAYLMNHPADNQQLIYKMFNHQAPFLYWPFLVLSLFATVIASQAMISGLFSVVYQGITTHMLPMLKVEYTSFKLRSQIYIGFVNWFLLIAVLFMIVQFKTSHNLTYAYGLAVSGTMSLTGSLMTWIFYLRKCYFKMSFSFLITLTNFVFLASNTFKIPNGGYWSIIIALIPFVIILIYSYGQKRLYKALAPQDLDVFLEKYNQNRPKLNRINGSALFFVRDVKAVPTYIAQTMFKNNIIYEDNVLISVVTRDDPFGVISFFKGTLAPGLRIFEIHRGYMEVIELEKILRMSGIEAKVIFYGLEDIVAKNPIWKVYAIIKRLAPSFVQFYKLPSYKLHGVITFVEL